VFTLLIVDHGTEFERVPLGYKGGLYVEIVPRAFSILVREGMKLNQLRFVCGAAGDESDAKLNKMDKKKNWSTRKMTRLTMGLSWFIILQPVKFG
jgi:dCTP deaminase